MTILFTDGFDSYATGTVNEQMRSRWNQNINISGLFLSPLTPHNHGNSLYISAVTGDAGSTRMNFRHMPNIPDDVVSGIIGFHFRTSDTTQDVTEPIMALRHLPTEGYELTLRIGANPSNSQLEIYRGNTILLGSGGVIANDTWYHVEWRYLTSGSIPASTNIVRLDGSEVIDLAVTTNTSAFQDGILTTIEIQGADLADRYWDNFYFLSLTGIANTGFIGPCFIETIYPTGDGATKNFTGSDGDQTNNYIQVDEQFPDDDTTYNQSSTSGDIDVYKFGNPTGNVGSIRGISLISRARKTSTSLGLWRNVARVSGTNYEQGLNPLHTTYDYFFDVLNVNPDTSGAWTTTHFSENSFGVKLEK